MADETPTPPQPGGIRGFWKRRSKWGKGGIIIGAVFVALIAIGLAVPAPEEDSKNTSAQVADETTTEEATTEEATTEEADDGDTGRMSEGEYDLFTSALREVDEEIQQFGTGMKKCGVLFQLLQLADASECVDDAYSGFDDKASFAYFQADDLKDDVAKGCLGDLNGYQDRLNSYATYVSNLHKAASNLQAKKTVRLAKQAKRQTAAYALTREVVKLSCAPQ